MSNYVNVIYICMTCLMRQKKFLFFYIDLQSTLYYLAFYLTYL